MVIDSTDLPDTRTYPHPVTIEVGPLELPTGGERLGYSLTGNYIPNPMKREAFSEALVASLEQSGMFSSVSSDGSSPYHLRVEGMAVKIPAGLNMSLVLNPLWSLTDERTGFILWQEQIVSEGEAGIGDAFDGGRRAKLVAIEAGKANITESLNRLSDVDLRPGFLASQVYASLSAEGPRVVVANRYLEESQDDDREGTIHYMISFAAKEDDDELLRWLLERDVNVDALDPSLGLAPLHVAAQQGSLSSVALLVDQSASLDAESDEGITPLYYAYFSGHTPVWKYLLDSGAGVAIEVTDDNAYEAARATSDFSSYLVDTGRIEEAAEVCQTAAHFHNRAAVDFDRTIEELDQIIGSTMRKNVLKAMLASLSAYNQARINARMSMTGRGFATSIYYVDSIDGMRALRGEYQQLAADSRAAALACGTEE